MICFIRPPPEIPSIEGGVGVGFFYFLNVPTYERTQRKPMYERVSF